MDYVKLGRTGIDVSVAGLGAGGTSRLGLRSGNSEDDAIAVIHAALDLGINYIDTARAYGTEDIVGRALLGRRDRAFISSKATPYKGRQNGRGELLTPAEFRKEVETSLELLQTDHIDVYHVHGLLLEDYDYCVSEFVPLLEELRSAGSIRFLAISELFQTENEHQMLEHATVAEPDWIDVAMVGFNIVNQTARRAVFPGTIKRNIGVEVMFAVRRLFSNPDELRSAVAGLVADGYLSEGLLDPEEPLGFLIHEGGATSLTDAAYRFARHEPGCHVVLTGTGSIEHLQENVVSINRPPLPEADHERLVNVFNNLSVLTGQ